MKYILASALAVLLLISCKQTSKNKTMERENTQHPISDKSLISDDFPYTKKFVEVNGHKMAYVDEGRGPVVLFVHGNPTSSYLWRNIIPYVSSNYRAIAVDLIGMGDSNKPDIDYTFDDHAKYLEGFIKALGLKKITPVIHDWGSALGMHYARNNEENIYAIAFMEALIPPALPIPSYDIMGPAAEMMRNIRTEGPGEKMILEQNFFIEEILPANVIRKLTDKEMEAYRRPFQTPESRLPTLMWPRQLPIEGKPRNMVHVIVENGRWLNESPVQKLFLHAVPGQGNPESVVEYVRNNAKNVKVVNIGEGLHFIQEDQPHAIGEALAEWLTELK